MRIHSAPPAIRPYAPVARPTRLEALHRAKPQPIDTPTTGNAISFTVDWEQTRPVVHEMLRSATRVIRLSMYAMGGESGMEVARILAEKHKQGVAVEVVVDPFLGKGIELVEGMMAETYNYLKDNGVPVRLYPIERLRTREHWMSNYQPVNHVKALVIDDREVMIGGMNFIDSEIDNHDVMLRIKGPAAVTVAEELAGDWTLTGGIPAPVGPPVNGGGTSAVRVTETDRLTHETLERILDNVAKAQQQINVSALFLSDKRLVDALIDARERGVRVRVILDDFAQSTKYVPITRHMPRGMVNLAFLRRMQKAGIELRWHHAKDPQTQPGLHMKLMTFDGKTTVVGSTNFDHLALHVNRELSVEVLDSDLTGRIDAMFNRDWSQSTEPIHLSWGQRIFGWLMRLFYRQV